MVRLTREVRFGIDVDGSVAPDGRNGFAGRPGLTGLGHFLVFRLTLEGEPDPQSGYLRNIKEIDDAVRRNVVPFLQTAIRKRGFLHDQRLADFLIGQITSLPGATIVAGELLLSPYVSLAWTHLEPDMIRLSQMFEFSAAHRLHNPELSPEENVATFGKCNNPHGHGHNYEVQVTVKGIPDSQTGQLIAVGELERLVDQHVIEALDHKHLNLEVPEFRTLNPSVENIAMVIYRRLEPVFSPLRATLDKVTVWETPKTWAEVNEEGMRAEASNNGQ